MKSDMLSVSKYEDIWTAILLQYTISSLYKRYQLLIKFSLQHTKRHLKKRLSITMKPHWLLKNSYQRDC